MLSLLVLGALWLSAPAHADLPSATGAVIHMRLPVEPGTLDWNLAYTSNETHVVMNLMEGLVEEGPEMKPQPALAEKWELSPDGKVYTFTLRKGIQWSDGKPLRAQDFEASWLRLLDPKTKSNYASFLFDLENAEDYHSGKIKDPAKVGLKVLNDSQLQVTLRQVVPYFLHLPTFWVTFPIRADLVKKYGAQWATPGKIATLGPYLLKSWKKGKSLELVRNPNYFGPAPLVESVEMTVEPDDGKARQLFESGKVDFLLEATTDDLLRVSSGVASSAAGAPRARVEQYPYLATYYLGFNVDAGPLRTVGIRKALAIAVAADREGIPSALQGGQMAAHGWIPPGMDGYDPNAKVSGTLYEARGLLTRAGFVEGRGFPKLPVWIEKFDEAEKLGDYLKKSLADRLSIDIEPRIGTMSEYDRLQGSARPALFVGHWGADYPDPSNFYEVFSGGVGAKRTGWHNADYDGLLERARGTLDNAARLALYSSAEKLLVETDSAILPLFYKRNAVLLGARILKFQISPLNYIFFKSVIVAAAK